MWAQKDPAIPGNSNIYIARLALPTSIVGQQVRLSTPTSSWEKLGAAVNEAPAGLRRNGNIFITYSVNPTPNPITDPHRSIRM